MDEELLISLVSQYKELYDTGDARYHDEQRRNNIWQEIADLMKLRPSECRDRWKRLRDNFRRAKNLRKTKSGQAATKNKPIKYEKEMQFLTCYLETQEKCLTNISRQSSDDEEAVLDNMSPPSTPGSQSQMSSYSTASCSKKKKVQDEYGQSSTSAKTLFQSYIKKKYDQPRQEPDTVVDFFTNLGRTVKTFPEDIQIRVKGSVFKIINDAELEMLHRKASHEQYFNRPTVRSHYQEPVRMPVLQTGQIATTESNTMVQSNELSYSLGSQVYSPVSPGQSSPVAQAGPADHANKTYMQMGEFLTFPER